uniref:L-seryl-tRNA(Sec) kinase isoform X2 n=1 Tax=Myxine glutinosa TaxID=7769 RepID=UPI00358E3008
MIVGPRVLCVLCGLPASGKSTLCARLRSRPDPRFLLLSYDSVLPAVAFRPQDAGETTHWKYYRQSVLDCLKHWLLHGCSTQDDIPANVPAEVWTLFLRQLQQHHLLDPPWSSIKASSANAQMPITFPEQSPHRLAIILDDNFYYRSMRYEVYQLAREVSAGFIQIFLNCPLELCLKRNASRIVPVPVMVLQTMAERLEVPDVEQRDWERESLHLDTSIVVPDVQIDMIMARIARAMENPVPAIEDSDSLEKAQSRAECGASLVHQVDVALRRCVSDTLKQLATGRLRPQGCGVYLRNWQLQKGLCSTTCGTISWPLRLQHTCKRLWIWLCSILKQRSRES